MTNYSEFPRVSSDDTVEDVAEILQKFQQTFAKVDFTKPSSSIFTQHMSYLQDELAKAKRREAEYADVPKQKVSPKKSSPTKSAINSMLDSEIDDNDDAEKHSGDEEMSVDKNESGDDDSVDDDSVDSDDDDDEDDEADVAEKKYERKYQKFAELVFKEHRRRNKGRAGSFKSFLKQNDRMVRKRFNEKSRGRNYDLRQDPSPSKKRKVSSPSKSLSPSKSKKSEISASPSPAKQRKPLYNKNGHKLAKFLCANTDDLIGEGVTDEDEVVRLLKQRLGNNADFTKKLKKGRDTLIEDARAFIEEFSSQQVSPDFHPVIPAIDAKTLLKSDPDIKNWFNDKVKENRPVSLLKLRRDINVSLDKIRTVFLEQQKTFEERLSLIDFRLANRKENNPRDEFVNKLLDELSLLEEDEDMSDDDDVSLGSQDD